jgi:hypothetical protein
MALETILESKGKVYRKDFIHVGIQSGSPTPSRTPLPQTIVGQRLRVHLPIMSKPCVAYAGKCLAKTFAWEGRPPEGLRNHQMCYHMVR